MSIFYKTAKIWLNWVFFWFSRSCWSFWCEKAQNSVKFEKNDVFGSGIAISAHYEAKNANFLKIAPIWTKTEFFWFSRSSWSFWCEKAQNSVKFEKNDVFGSGIAISAHFEVKNANFLQNCSNLTKTEFFWFSRSCWSFWREKAQNSVKFEKNDVFGSGIAISAHFEVKNANFYKTAKI